MNDCWNKGFSDLLKIYYKSGRRKEDLLQYLSDRENCINFVLGNYEKRTIEVNIENQPHISEEDKLTDSWVNNYILKLIKLELENHLENLLAHKPKKPEPCFISESWYNIKPIIHDDEIEDADEYIIPDIPVSIENETTNIDEIIIEEKIKLTNENIILSEELKHQNETHTKKNIHVKTVVPKNPPTKPLIPEEHENLDVNLKEAEEKFIIKLKLTFVNGKDCPQTKNNRNNKEKQNNYDDKPKQCCTGTTINLVPDYIWNINEGFLTPRKGRIKNRIKKNYGLSKYGNENLKKSKILQIFYKGRMFK